MGTLPGHPGCRKVQDVVKVAGVRTPLVEVAVRWWRRPGGGLRATGTKFSKFIPPAVVVVGFTVG